MARFQLKKTPSPDAKPAIHSGWGTFKFSTSDLETGIISGKAAFKSSLRPKFKLAFIATIDCNPSLVKWAFCLNYSKPLLNKR